MESYKGTPASSGIALGKAYIYEKPKINISTDNISPNEAEAEADKFRCAVEKSREQIAAIAQIAEDKMGTDSAKIFLAHLEMLDDPALEESVLEKICSEYKNAVLAVHEAKEELCSMLSCAEDEYFRERVLDVEDVCGRIMCNILGKAPADLQHLSQEAVVVAEDLTPSATAAMDRSKVLAFVTETGGKTSHSAIMARTLEIPAVVGLSRCRGNIAPGDFVIVDGNEGTVIVNPDGETTRAYEEIKKRHLAQKEELRKILKEDAVTPDGRRVELFANIGNPRDVEAVMANNGEGIGLFRTEFLYMDGKRFPPEDEQFAAYKEAAKGMEGRPVIIRTLDIGGDKHLPYFEFPKEENPFLGYRAIRLCLDRPDIFKTQLRAILRASVFGKLRIMLPMIISLEELRESKKLLQECKAELISQGCAIDEGIETGIMIETPAAVIMAEALAREADFFSIGTNDLTQYILAVDRGNETIGGLFSSYHPAVLRSIKTVIDAAHREGKPVGMCGEFAGDERAVPLLLGLGLDEFSVSASSLLRVKKIIRSWSYSQAKALAEAALRLSTVSEVDELL